MTIFRTSPSQKGMKPRPSAWRIVIRTNVESQSTPLAMMQLSASTRAAVSDEVRRAAPAKIYKT